MIEGFVTVASGADQVETVGVVGGDLTVVVVFQQHLGQSTGSYQIISAVCSVGLSLMLWFNLWRERNSNSQSNFIEPQLYSKSIMALN